MEPRAVEARVSEVSVEELKTQLEIHLSAAAKEIQVGGGNSTILHLETLAAQLLPVIGNESFQSLFSRSLHMTSRQFPWLAMDLKEWDHTNRFSGLQANLGSRNASEAGAAGAVLLTTFVETLVQLLDVPIVTNVLRAAWGNDIAQRWTGFEGDATAS
jgi:hypothetical protein